MSSTRGVRESCLCSHDDPGCCPECGADLVVHQPDLELPDRLLAVCEECKAWFLTSPELDSLILLPLPQSESRFKTLWEN